MAELSTLNLTNQSLHGRDEEIGLLRDAYDNCCCSIFPPPAAESVAKEAETKPSSTSSRSTCGSRPSIIFVFGYSGCGKSVLVERSLKEYCTNSSSNHNTTTTKGYYVTGKYDQQHQQVSSSSSSGSGSSSSAHAAAPFSAILDACSNLVEQLIENGVKWDTNNGDADMNNYIGSLTTILPRITDLLGKQQQDDEPTKGEDEEEMNMDLSWLVRGQARQQQKEEEELSYNYKMGFEALKKALGKLLRKICSESPVVMVLEDIQWADSSSIEIIKDLQMQMDGTDDTDYDKGNNSNIPALTRLLLVCTYRDNELNVHNTTTNGVEQPHRQQQHPLADDIALLQKHPQARNIHLTDLSKESTNQLIAGLLSRSHDLESTIELTEAVYGKTGGNAMFTVQILKLLRQLGILEYSYSQLKWTWNMQKLQSDVKSSENVVDVVLRRLDQLPKAAVQDLVIAACLGYRFDKNILIFILQDFHGDDFDRTSFEERFQIVLEEGYLVALGSSDKGHYKFSHDRIQQAAYALVKTEKERKDLLLRIGMTLWGLHREQQRDNDDNSNNSKDGLLLTIVAQLNQACDRITDAQTRIELAQLNKEAAQKVSAKSAFFPAVEFMKQAIFLLGDKKWSKTYDLSLEMHTIYANFLLCCGSNEECKDVVGKILIQAKHQSEKMDAYRTLINCHASMGEWDKVFEVAYDVLAQCGEKFPKNPGIHHVLIEAIRAKLAVKRMTDEDLLALPEQELDKTQLVALRIIGDLFAYAWQSGRSNDFPILTSRMARRTFEKGRAEMTPFFMAAYGLVNAKMGNISEAYRFCELGMKMLKQTKNGSKWQSQLAVAVMHSHHYRNPTNQLLGVGLSGYKHGMEQGTIYYASTAIFNYIIAYFMAGLPIKIIVQDSKEYISEMKDYEQFHSLPTVQTYRQCFLNLSGVGKNTNLLQGEALEGLDVAKILQEGKKYKDTRTLQSVTFGQLILAYYFQDYKLAKKMAKLHSSFHDDEWPVFWSYIHPFFRAMAYLGAFKAGAGGRKNLKRANANIKRIRWFCKNGMLNCVHMLAITEAELLSAMKPNKVEDVRKAYDAAIRAAKRSGFVHDSALAYERAGIYFLDRDRGMAEYYLKEALDHYGMWGAMAKVEHVTTFAKMDEGSTHSAVSTASSAPRFSSSSGKHQRLNDSAFFG